MGDTFTFQDKSQTFPAFSVRVSLSADFPDESCWQLDLLARSVDVIRLAIEGGRALAALASASRSTSTSALALESTSLSTAASASTLASASQTSILGCVAKVNKDNRFRVLDILDSPK